MIPTSVGSGSGRRKAARIPEVTIASVSRELIGIITAATSGFMRPATAMPTASTL